MTLEAKTLLLDVLEAASSIEQRCAGHSFEEYVAKRLATAGPEKA